MSTNKESMAVTEKGSIGMTEKESQGGMGEIVSSRVAPATLHFDGACRGNPGTAGIGFVLRDGNGRVIERFSRLLGYNLTKDVADDKALTAGLRHALDNRITDIVAYGDSELVCNQVNRQSGQVRDERLRRYHNNVLELQSRFQTCSVQHVSREQNNDADVLANSGIDNDPVDRRTDEMFRRIGNLHGAINDFVEKRSEGFYQLCFILETIEQNSPELYVAVQQWCRDVGKLTGMNVNNPGMASFLVQY